MSRAHEELSPRRQCEKCEKDGHPSARGANQVGASRGAGLGLGFGVQGHSEERGQESAFRGRMPSAWGHGQTSEKSRESTQVP